MSSQTSEQNPEGQNRYNLEEAEALNKEEGDVLATIADGASRSDVAESLGISEEMIDRHLANVLDKLHRHGDRRSAAPLSTVGSEPEEDSERPTTFGS